ncbi:MAG: sigma-70 family RNA polymerase sigma factor [Nitrolancea sp.]
MASDSRNDVNAAEFDELRPLLFSIAYRMLSSVADAEDVVQDAFLRYQRARSDGTKIASIKAYLSAVVTRLAIDQLRSARRRRETYSGQWLPEPILTDDEGPARVVERADSLSMAFLLVLERLSPVERAVFLLHDVFAFDYDEIAKIVERSPANCRQLSSRARRHVEEEKPRFEPSSKARDELATHFFAAATRGDMDGLVSMLASDVVVYGDGGGKAPQWSRPIVGRERVARLFVGMSGQMARADISLELRQFNGQPGALTRDRDGRVASVFVLEIEGGEIRAVRSIINPDKLRHLGLVADAWQLAHEAAQNRAREE